MHSIMRAWDMHTHTNALNMNVCLLWVVQLDFLFFMNVNGVDWSNTHLHQHVMFYCAFLMIQH